VRSVRAERWARGAAAQAQEEPVRRWRRSPGGGERRSPGVRRRGATAPAVARGPAATAPAAPPRDTSVDAWLPDPLGGIVAGLLLPRLLGRKDLLRPELGGRRREASAFCGGCGDINARVEVQPVIGAGERRGFRVAPTPTGVRRARPQIFRSLSSSTDRDSLSTHS
jgi:hypothetical protein